jgi:hypothetical protein
MPDQAVIVPLQILSKSLYPKRRKINHKKQQQQKQNSFLK